MRSPATPLSGYLSFASPTLQMAAVTDGPECAPFPMRPGKYGWEVRTPRRAGDPGGTCRWGKSPIIAENSHIGGGSTGAKMRRYIFFVYFV